MRFGLLVVIALAISAIAAQFLLQDPGYVVINFRNYLIEMSVPVLISLVAILFIAIWLIGKLIKAPKQLGAAAGRYRSYRAANRLTRGLIEVAEGNFAKGERILIRSAGVSDTPLLNYLQAARAAHLQGHYQQRDNWLRQAYERMPEAASAVLITQAELQIDEGEYEQALATLRRLEQNAPGHAQAMMLLGRLYYRLKDWNSLEKLLPKLSRKKNTDPDTLLEWQTQVQLQHLRKDADYETLKNNWDAVPKELRQQTRVFEAYIESLTRVDQHDLAEKELIRKLKRDWQGPLAALFGKVKSSNSVRQLKRAEGWLQDHPEDPDLLLAAARLCVRNELWGQARSYLETTLSLRPTPEAYNEYGQLLARLGDADAAAKAYRDGLGIVAGGTAPAIPHLQPDRD